jgi:hypothetical protein
VIRQTTCSRVLHSVEEEVADTCVVGAAQTPLFGFMILQFLAGVLEIQDEDSDVW